MACTVRSVQGASGLVVDPMFVLCTVIGLSAEDQANAHQDSVVAPEGSRAYGERYLGPADGPCDPLYADLADLACFPPACVEAGTAELLVGDSLRLSDPGLTVELDIWPAVLRWVRARVTAPGPN